MLLRTLRSFGLSETRVKLNTVHREMMTVGTVLEFRRHYVEISDVFASFQRIGFGACSNNRPNLMHYRMFARRQEYNERLTARE